MPLTEKAYLEIEDADDTGVFELQIDLEHTTSVSKEYVMGNRGQYIREFVSKNPDNAVNLAESKRRTGFWLDAGMGNWEETIAFKAGTEESSIKWGDGDGGTGAANITARDATGAGINPFTRMQILTYWIARTRSDSFGRTRIHMGEWTDGTYPESAAGVFENPMPVAITDMEFENPEDDPNAFTGTLTVSHVAIFPASEDDVASWIDLTAPSPILPPLPTGVYSR